MFDSDEKFTLLIALVFFWLLCGAIAGSIYFKVEVLIQLFSVCFVIMLFAMLSFSAEVVEDLDRAKWFWCPLVLVLPFFTPLILLFLSESEDGPFGIGWILEKFGIDTDWDEDGLLLLGGLLFAALLLGGLGLALYSYYGMTLPYAIGSVVAVAFALFLLLYFFFGREDEGSYVPSSSGISDNPNWCCPQCSTILQKGNIELMKALGGASVVGVATCGSCGASFSQREVYSGRYDA